MSRSPASIPSGALPPSAPSPGEALDLSISGSQLSVSRRPSSASPGKHFSRSVSVIAESRHKRNTLSDALGGPRSIKNLRRSNSTTQVNQSHSSPLSPDQNEDVLTLFDSASDGQQKLCSLSKASPDRTTWNILDDQPRASLLQSSPRSSSSVDSQNGFRKREAGLSLAPTFNNRSNKGAVGNSVTTILHNNHSEKPLTPKSSNQRPTFNNILKANDEVSQENSSVIKSQKNFSSSIAVLQHQSSPVLLSPRRREVSKEEAERFIQQVNLAAVTIQRWYRRHKQRRSYSHSHTALTRLLSSKRKEWEERAEEERGTEQQKDEDRKRIREDKARQARLAAIQELQQKRTQHSLEPQFNSVQPQTSRLSTTSRKKLFKSSSENRRAENSSAAGAPTSPSDKNNNHTDLNLNVDFTELTFRAVSPASTNHRGSHCSQDDRAEEDMSLSEDRKTSRTHLRHTQRPSAEPEPVRLSAMGRKKPPRICAPKSLTAAAPMSPSDNKTNNTTNNTDSNLNVVSDFTELTFRAVSPGSSNHRGSHCSQELVHRSVSAEDHSRTQSKTTLNELLDSLKLLEDETHSLVQTKENHKDSWIHQDGDATSLTTDNLQRHVQQSFPPLPEGGALLSEAKLQSIMSFLDEMEKSEQERPRSATSGSHREMVLSEEDLAAVDQASATAAELSGSVIRTRLELEEKKRTVNMLQAALAQQRELTVHHVKETEKELNRNFQLHKEQYEATIQRHLAFIDQLISDKKALSERCEGVVAELKQVDQKYTKKISQMQEQHEMEIKKLKELMAASEKIRREKWIDEKTKKIKEITVKGLEPEIQKLISKHKQELKKLRSLHEAELLQADERAAQRFIQQTEELRERLDRDRELQCQRERELAKHRYEKQLQEEELSLQQQRRRLYKEVADEKERLAELAARQRAELEDLRRQLEENSSVAGQALRQELDKSREEQERRHQMELKALQERMELEKQTWEENYKKKEEAWLLSRERELKEELKRERDKEIELAIWTLEEQTSKERDECERTADNRVKRVREKYEVELTELERSERAAVERHQELRMKLMETEEELMRAKSELRQKDQTMEELTQSRDKLTEERRSLSDVIRQEFAERLVLTEDENRRMKVELSELRARLRLEVERVTREKEEELQEVHQRVKAAILKKEETVNNLRKQHEAAVKRADHLEALWEQQRKQLLDK